MASLKLTADAAGQAVELVNRFCGNVFAEVSRGADALEARTADGKTLSGLTALATHIAGASAKAKQLLGETEVQAAQV